jgi:hypothetical protein
MFGVMNGRWLFLCGALLPLVWGNGAFADEGTYQRSKDGKAIVWNSYPIPGESVEWSGKQDKEGYATGYGTVTWYKMARSNFTFSKPHSVVSGRFSGKMVKGKLEGDVVKESAGQSSLIRWTPATGDITTHAKFAGGSRVSEWVTGPAAPNPSKTITASAKAPEESASPEVTQQPSTKQKIYTPAKETSRPADDSLRSVTAPPSSLQSSRMASASSESSASPAPTTTTSSQSADRPELTTREVIELADSVARANGIDLTKYQNPHAQYAAEEEAWAVAYDQKAADGPPEPGRNFIVSVGDKTKRTSIGPGKF